MRLLFFPFLCLILFPLICYSSQSEVSPFPKITLELKNMPFDQALEKVASQTNLLIKIDENLAKKKISGVFVDNDLDLFLSKCLRDHNYTFVHDASMNTLTIRTFGTKDSQLVTIKTIKPATEISPLVNIDLEQLREKENIAHRKYLSNPKSIEPLTGVPLASILKRSLEENINYSNYIDAFNSTEPLTKIELQEIRTLTKNETNSYHQYLNNPNSLEPLTGIKLQDIVDIKKNENNRHQLNTNYTEPLTDVILK